MAFGEKTKQYHDAKASGTGGTGEGQKLFTSQWIPTGPGTVIFRPLQVVEDGKVVLTERKSASGKVVREGGSKTGKVLMGPEPAEETVFMYAWWEVNVGGNKVARRIMLDPFAGGDVNKARFNNPLWKFIADNFKDKAARERKAIKQAFALNVWDKTPVMEVEGKIYYPAEDGTWRKLAYMDKGRLVSKGDSQNKLPEHYNASLEDALENGWATPLNEVRILEGSYGKPLAEGGKHLFAQFEALFNTVEDGDGVIRRLGEFDLRLSTTGEGIGTQRAIRNLSNFKPLSDEANLSPRYDLATWTKPWPDEVVQALIDGEDFNDIVEQYKLATFPALFDTDETTTETPVAEDDEALFDD